MSPPPVRCRPPPSIKLLLDRKGGIEHGSLIKAFLGSDLHFDDETGSVFVRTFYVDPDTPPVRKGIDVICVRVTKSGDVTFRKEFLQEKLEEAFPAIVPEGALEPVVHDDPGVSADGRMLRHSFRRITGEKRKRPIPIFPLRRAAHGTGRAQSYERETGPARPWKELFMIIVNFNCFLPENRKNSSHGKNYSYPRRFFLIVHHGRQR